MEPISIIITALTLGIAAGLKPTAEQAVKDAYTGLKQLIEKRYDVSLNNLENTPKSNAQQAAVKESLTNANGVEQDEDLLDKAKELIDLIKDHDTEVATAQAVIFEEVEAGYIKVKGVIAKGSSTAVKMTDVQTEGAIEIEDVTAEGGAADPKAQRQ